MNPLKTFLKICIPLLIILSAVLCGFIIISSTKKPERKKPQRTAYAVEVRTLKADTQTVKLQATGTVSSSVEITLRARVVGEIIEVSPEFIDGGTFKQGERILTIDPVDYELALAQKQAALAEAEYQLQLEKGKGEIAAREWELLGTPGEDSAADRELALRIPHLKYRAAKLTAALAELQTAKLNLARTEVRAPFNAIVVERKTDLGTQASTQDALAFLAGSDQFYVRASIPVSQLKWIQAGAENGSVVTINRNAGDTRIGRVIRVESALEETGRMARILIAVDRPTEGEFPMLLNEYVRVEIEGNTIPNSYQIPREALHEDQLVWLATPEGTLEIRAVDVRWRDATDVIVTGGINDGERLILTNLSTPINDMKLRIEGDPVQEKQGKEQGAGSGKSGKGTASNEK